MTTRSGCAERSTVCRFTRPGMAPPLAGEGEADVVRVGRVPVADVDGVEATAGGGAIAPDLPGFGAGPVRGPLRGGRDGAARGRRRPGPPGGIAPRPPPR